MKSNFSRPDPDFRRTPPIVHEEEEKADTDERIPNMTLPDCNNSEKHQDYHRP
jgi:hypothetical protein